MAPWPLSTAFPLTLFGAVALILAVDAAAAWLTRERPAMYRRIWPVQFGIYVVIGFVAMLALLDLRLVQIVGALTGFAEATAGWAITWRIGPGRVPHTNPVSVIVVALDDGVRLRLRDCGRTAVQRGSRHDAARARLMRTCIRNGCLTSTRGNAIIGA